MRPQHGRRPALSRGRPWRWRHRASSRVNFRRCWRNEALELSLIARCVPFAFLLLRKLAICLKATVLTDAFQTRVQPPLKATDALSRRPLAPAKRVSFELRAAPAFDRTILRRSPVPRYVFAALQTLYWHFFPRRQATTAIRSLEAVRQFPPLSAGKKAPQAVASA